MLQNAHATTGSVQTVWWEQEDVSVIKAGKEPPALWVRRLIQMWSESDNNKADK